MADLEGIWRRKSDEQLREAMAYLSDYGEAGQRVIRGEFARRGLEMLAVSVTFYDARSIGRLHRWFAGLVAAQWTALIVVLAARGLFSRNIDDTLQLLALVTLLGTIVAVPFVAHNLLKRLGVESLSWGMGLAFVPLASLLVFFGIRSDVERWGKLNGVEIGALGPTANALAELPLERTRDGVVDVVDVEPFDEGEIAGMRTAGWILLATVAINLLTFVMRRTSIPPLATLVDLFLGVQLLRLKHSWRAWALVRAGIGGALSLVVIAAAALQSPPAVAASAIVIGQLAYCGSLFLLLSGRPSMRRVVAGRVVFGVAIVLWLTGGVLAAARRPVDQARTGSGVRAWRSDSPSSHASSMPLTLSGASCCTQCETFGRYRMVKSLV